MLVGYDDFMDAVRFSDVLAHKNGLLLKEIAPIAVYLASDEAAYVTGQTLHINGGGFMG